MVTNPFYIHILQGVDQCQSNIKMKNEPRFSNMPRCITGL